MIFVDDFLMMLLWENHDFIFAVGDDITDEYLFEELPERSYTIKVGSKNTCAKYNIANIKKVHEKVFGSFWYLIYKFDLFCSFFEGWNCIEKTLWDYPTFTALQIVWPRPITQYTTYKDMNDDWYSLHSKNHILWIRNTLVTAQASWKWLDYLETKHATCYMPPTTNCVLRFTTSCIYISQGCRFYISSLFVHRNKSRTTYSRLSWKISYSSFLLLVFIL